MTKQEEIREGLYIQLCKRDKGMDFSLTEKQQRWLVGHTLSYLHSQGAVIKVDRELPKSIYGGELPNEPYLISNNTLRKMRDAEESSQQRMLRWHNDSFEPLIKEDSNGKGLSPRV